MDYDSSGNLLATAGQEGAIKIYDVRHNQITKKYENIHRSKTQLIRCYLFNSKIQRTSKDVYGAKIAQL